MSVLRFFENAGCALKCTSRQGADIPTFLSRPTGPHLAAFILPSVGRSASAPMPTCQTRDIMRQPAKCRQSHHGGLPSVDLGTNRPLACSAAVGGRACGGSDFCVSAARGSLAVRLADGLSNCCSLTGKRPRDPPRCRSCGHGGYDIPDVHDVHFTGSRSVVFWTAVRMAQDLWSSRARLPMCRRGGRPVSDFVVDPVPNCCRRLRAAAVGIVTGKNEHRRRWPDS